MNTSTRFVMLKIDWLESNGWNLPKKVCQIFPRPAGVPQDLAKHSELMFDMMTLAMQTDSSRILSFMFTNAGSNRSYPEIGVSEGHHESSHHGKSEHKQQNIAKINRFHVDRFAYFLSRLSQVRENNGRRSWKIAWLFTEVALVMETAIIMTICQYSLRVRAGRIQTGRHIQYENGTPLCNLYLWMMRQMGAKAESFE